MSSPIWSSSPVSDDPLFFIQADNEAVATARLLFTPQHVPVLTKATGEITYEAGRDFAWEPGTRVITLTPESRIPFRPQADLFLPPDSPNSIAASLDGSTHLLFGEGRFFHDQQALAAYQPAEPWTGPIPASDAAGLARTHARFQARLPVKIVLLGDSISTGANASGVTGAPPFRPPYHDILVHGLRQKFGSSVTLRNLSVGGMDSTWGIEQMPAAVNEAPDLFIIAFGMNDASGRRPCAEFLANITKMATAMRDAHPACDVIAVASMTANSAWSWAAPDLYPAYRDGLRSLRAPGFAVADVTAPWTWIAARKNYQDLTGNGVNHPNDFGHRLYADVLLALFG